MEKIKSPKKSKHKDFTLSGPSLLMDVEDYDTMSENNPYVSKLTVSPNDSYSDATTSNTDSTTEASALALINTKKIKPKISKTKPFKPDHSTPTLSKHNESFLRTTLSPKLMSDDFKVNMNKLEPLLESDELLNTKQKKNKKRKIDVEVKKQKLESDGKADSKPKRPKTSHGSPTHRKDSPIKQAPVKVEPPKVAKDAKDLKENDNIKEEVFKKYPILKDEDLIKRFRNVVMTNNQKGRIRQTLKEIFQGTSSSMLPDIIYNKIQHILKSSPNLTDADLRKLRVLYNMLQVAAKTEKPSEKKAEIENPKKKVSVKPGIERERNSPDRREELGPKVKSAKRYVVFVGNLPLDINKETLLEHFSDLRNYIKDIRIPPPREGKKSAIAYVELVNEPSYEMALSKHHSMLGNKRINVLYTAQKNSKVTKAEAKGKTAKLVALVKSGQMLGSMALKKKRSQRRAKFRQAMKEAAAAKQ